MLGALQFVLLSLSVPNQTDQLAKARLLSLRRRVQRMSEEERRDLFEAPLSREKRHTAHHCEENVAQIANDHLRHLY